MMATRYSWKSGYLHIAVLTLFMAYGSVRISTSALPFTWQHGLAIILLCLCWLARATDRSWWKLALIMTLLVGTFNIALFGSGELRAGTSFTHQATGFHFQVGLDPLLLILLISACWIWRKDLRIWRESLRVWLSPIPTAAYMERVQKKRVSVFTRNLEIKTTEELRAMLRSNDELVPDARKAAEEILARRIVG